MSVALPAPKKLFTLLDLCVSSLRRGHANLLCIVPILTDDPRRESKIEGDNNGQCKQKVIIDPAHKHNLFGTGRRQSPPLIRPGWPGPDRARPCRPREISGGTHESPAVVPPTLCGKVWVSNELLHRYTHNLCLFVDPLRIDNAACCISDYRHVLISPTKRITWPWGSL